MRQPPRPLRDGATVLWIAPGFRVYHRDERTPSPETRRTFGPVARFDPHQAPASTPRIDPDGRGVVYLGGELTTALREVFERGQGTAEVCPAWRAAAVVPIGSRVPLLDLVRGADRVEAPDELGDAVRSYTHTQPWGRAVYEDQPSDAVGLWYWSARDRDPDGERAGVNTATFDTSGDLTTFASTHDGGNVLAHDFALQQAGMWDRVVGFLGEAGVDATRIGKDACARCTSR